jgi:SAM-dependent methyltransferase
MGYQTIGLEYCGELLEHGKAAFPQVDLRQGDARNLEFPENHFDVTWFSTNGIDYMHPVAEREKVLHEMIRCTKPGGLIAIWSHNAFGVLRRLLSPPALTRRALQFALDQIVAWKRRSGWYFVWRDQFLGRPLFYSAPPSHQVQKFRQLGLEIVEVRSVERPGRAVSWWQDVHVLYVCRKPL